MYAVCGLTVVCGWVSGEDCDAVVVVECVVKVAELFG